MNDDSQINTIFDANVEVSKAEICDGRLKGKFVSKYTINLSRRNLTENLLCKGFNFISTCNKVEVKVRIGTIGRMICAKWNFRND